ncbi:MAG: 2-hydroxy-acid oxidase [Humibacillus sp.]|nr:2-hydroxy-acid oxidase [Humibacillus sp.]
MAPEVFAYFAAGAGAETTLRQEAQAWDSVHLRPRVLRDVTAVEVGTSVLGTRVALPVLVAPVASHRAAHPDGELGVARAVRRAGGLMVLSMRSSTRVEEVGAAAGAFWQQLYVLRDRGITDEVARRAADAGATALVVTVDTPVVASKRADLPPPQEHGIVEALDHRDATDPRLQQAADLSGADLERLGALTGLPVVAKGVLTAAAARDCVAAGARGVIVSTHGGRQLDGVLPSPRALPEVVDAVGEQVEVYVDGAVRAGAHVLKALALGARATLVGRPVVWALAGAGGAGVHQLLDDLADETREAFALAGCASVALVGRDLAQLG